jgi:hypothetical protein
MSLTGPDGLQAADQAGLLDAVSHAHPVVEVNLRQVTFLECAGIGAPMAANNVWTTRPQCPGRGDRRPMGTPSGRHRRPTGCAAGAVPWPTQLRSRPAQPPATPF